jgi:hypothetical protein
MMSKRPRLLGCATVVVVLWVGCSGDDQRPAAVPEQPVAVIEAAGRLPVCRGGNDTREPACDRCEKDEDCPSGLCADGKCTDISVYGYGEECNPNWLTPRRKPPAKPDGVPFYRPLDDPCGDRLCIDRRCRSCSSDEECRREADRRAAMGWGPRDTRVDICASPAERPGYFCYSVSAPLPPETALGVTRVAPRPPVVAPEGGFPHRSVPWGGACVRDGDCQSLFCDRGVCEELYGRGNFGHSCNPAEYQGTLEEIRKRASAEDGCGGYICRDQRCRPCQSDSDCPHGLPPLKCVTQELHRGKVCAGLARPISPRNHIPPPHRAPAPTPSPPASAAPAR